MFRYQAKAYDSKGQHIGPGPWLTVIRTANGLAQDAGGEAIFGSPTSTGDWWAGGYVEEYPTARVIHNTDESVTITAKDDETAAILRRADEEVSAM